MHLYTPVTFNGKLATAMIDSGATGNFLSFKALEQFRITKQQKQHSYSLRCVDGTENAFGRVTHETQMVTLTMGEHQEKISLDITDTGADEIILGLPWLRQHNPNIDWTSGKLQFTRCIKCQHARPRTWTVPSEDDEHDEDVIRESTPALRLKTRD